jgi:LPXTG-site transpeptidase (sortase) family protein
MRFFSFAATFVVLFGLTYVFLAMVDALPEPRGTTNTEVVDEPIDTPVGVAEQPVRIEARDVGLDSKIITPASLDVDVLNAAVDRAAVHYPSSGLLGQNGTVLLMGHSSHLPIVHNQAFKTFNGIEKLKEGQVISVYSGTTEYRYTVKEVRFAKAVAHTDGDVIELRTDGKYLTLVTCDNFGVKSDRWIVTADFAGAYSI